MIHHAKPPAARRAALTLLARISLFLLVPGSIVVPASGAGRSAALCAIQRVPAAQPLSDWLVPVADDG